MMAPTGMKKNLTLYLGMAAFPPSRGQLGRVLVIRCPAGAPGVQVMPKRDRTLQAAGL